MESSVYLRILGLGEQASDDEIKVAHRRLAFLHHPDRHSTADKKTRLEHENKLKQINEAYAELILRKPTFINRNSEEYQRKFAEAFRKMVEEESKKGNVPIYTGDEQEYYRHKRLNIPLEDFYFERTQKFNLKVKVDCSNCTTLKCKLCNGNGNTFHTIKVNNKRTEKLKSLCEVCKGKGSVLKPKHLKRGCKKCGNSGKTTIKKKTIIPLPRGTPDGARVVQNNVEFVLYSKHKIFDRRGDNIVMTKKISLADALFGFKMIVPHFSGDIIIQSKKLIQPQSSRIIKGYGMPINPKNSRTRSKGKEFGDLYIRFEVELPELDDEGLKKIKEVGLPSFTDVGPEHSKLPIMELENYSIFE